MNKHKEVSKGQPEVLAALAVAARSGGKKPDSEGLTASPTTTPKPARQARQVDAATKVLREGATGQSQDADQAVHALPDRARE